MKKKKHNKTIRKSSHEYTWRQQKKQKKILLCTATIAHFFSACEYVHDYGLYKAHVNIWESKIAFHIIFCIVACSAYACVSICVCIFVCVFHSRYFSRILLPSLGFYDISITCMSRHFESHLAHSLPSSCCFSSIAKCKSKCSKCIWNASTQSYTRTHQHILKYRQQDKSII